MKSPSITRTSDRPSHVFGAPPKVAGILIAHASPNSTEIDRCKVGQVFNVGRDPKSNLAIHDDKISKHHFRISQSHNSYWIEDLDSTNGTFVNGTKITSTQPLGSPAVIRAGRATLVFHEDAESLLLPPRDNNYNMAGPFHTGGILQELAEAALSSRHLLLAGPSGTGKELAAQAYARMLGSDTRPLPLLPHNAARFTSEEEAASTLFGISERVFSNVDSRPGLITQASGGILFLDEIHNLPERVQRSLLRVIEDGQLTPIGDTRVRPAKVRFVFASNAPEPTYCLAHDLLARLRVVKIPSLAARVADVPAIFDVAMGAALRKQAIDETSVFSVLGGDHYEALCLDGFATDNARGLVDLADRIATRIASGVTPLSAINSIFGERFGDGAVAKRYCPDDSNEEGSSHYEQNKMQIIAAFRESGGNLSATERLLRSRGIRCSRRWLGIFAERWGLRS